MLRLSGRVQVSALSAPIADLISAGFACHDPVDSTTLYLMAPLRDLSYDDALIILTGTDKNVVDRLDKVLTWGILGSVPFVGPSVSSLIGPKNEAKKLSEKAIGEAGARLRGLSMADRSQRIEAALQVILVQSLLEATAEILGEAWIELQITDSEVSRLLSDQPPKNLTDLKEFLAHIKVAMPNPAATFSENLDEVQSVAYRYVDRLYRFLRGLSLFDDQHDEARARVTRELRNDLPRLSRSKYEASFRRLAGEVPELAMWTNLREHHATHSQIADLVHLEEESRRDAVERLDAIRVLLAGLAEAVGGAAPERARVLSRHYGMELKRPVVDVIEGESMLPAPSIEDIFINPSSRIAIYDSTAAIANEGWWSSVSREEDAQSFIGVFVTTPAARELPLLILGHPGAGKSVLSKVVAANLDPSVFLPIRVPLRDVSASGTIQEQIDQALYLTLHERVTWVQLAREMPDRLPVVILDGLDELIQASGSSRSNYLEQVKDFQWSSSSQSRPVVVIVTSRTAVADSARVAAGSIVMKLQPFDTFRIETWVNRWNTRFGALLETSNTNLLELDVVLRTEELASHPILLLMLALFDADGNGLDDESLVSSEGGLYEQLLTRFVKRELLKSVQSISGSTLRKRIEEEMYYLSLVALAMFNRGEQIVRLSDVEKDFAALGVQSNERVAEDFDELLGHGGRMLGRFFFLSHSQARVLPRVSDSSAGDASGRSMEFVHATFGEYLVTRLFVSLLDGAERVTSPAMPWQEEQRIFSDDALRILYSFQPLVARKQVVVFLSEMLRKVDPSSARRALETFLAQSCWTIGSATRDVDYSPVSLDGSVRLANYSVNLVVAYACISGEISIADLLSDRSNAVHGRWRSLTLLWKSRLDAATWKELTSLLVLKRRVEADIQYSVTLDAIRNEYVNPVDEYLDGGGTLPSYEGEDVSSALISDASRRPELLRIVGAFEGSEGRGDLSNDFLERAGVKALEYLHSSVGAVSEVVLLFDDPWMQIDHNAAFVNGVHLSNVLLQIAFPTGLVDQKAYQLVLASGGGNGFFDLKSSRQVLRFLEVDGRMLPAELVRALLDLCASVSPQESDHSFYGRLCVAAAGTLSRCTYGDDRNHVLEIASEAFSRLDALHLATQEPAEYIRLAMAIEEMGVQVSDVASEFGSFEDHVRRVSPSGLSNDTTMSVRLLSFIRQRLMSRLAADFGVDLLLALSHEDAFDLIPVLDVHFVFRSSLVHDAANSFHDMVEMLRDKRPEALLRRQRWEFSSEAEADMFEYLEYRAEPS